MASYLDNYGKSEARRENILKGLLIAIAVIAVASGALYFFLRDFKERRQLSGFHELLDKKNYKAAYALWGCTDAAPCSSYKYERFLLDWGPNSAVGKGAPIKVSKTHSCEDTVIQIWTVGAKETVNLLVNRHDQAIGFAPWPMCNPRMKMD